MIEPDISSLKQFGSHISQSQPKMKKNSNKHIIKNKKKSKDNKFIKKIGKNIIKQKKRLFFYMTKKYHQLTQFLFLKKQYIKQKSFIRKNAPNSIQQMRLKETKKQIGNSTIIIRKRVRKYPTEVQVYNEQDTQSSTLFDIPINDNI